MFEERSFLGRGWSFPPEFTKNNKKLLMVSEEQDIEESLKILLTTTPGERLMQPEYGCNLRLLVFEHFSLSEQTIAREMIRRAILFYESRIKVNDIKFNTDNLHDGYIQILIDYTIQATNTRFNMVYPYYLREGTGVEFK